MSIGTMSRLARDEWILFNVNILIDRLHCDFIKYHHRQETGTIRSNSLSNFLQLM